MIQLSRRTSQYGAQMGRPNIILAPESSLYFNLYRVPLVDGGYDNGGAYWGVSTTMPLWHSFDKNGNELFFRAPDREAARTQVLETFPYAKFFK